MARRRYAKYTPNKRRDKEMIAAIDVALMAAAERLLQRVREEFASRGGGFKAGAQRATGEYPSGLTVDSLRIGMPSREGGGEMQSGARTVSGARRIRVFTTAQRVDDKTGEAHPYPAYWEVGHSNLFTQDYEHEPVFTAILAESRNDIVDAIIQARSFGITRRGTIIPGTTGPGGVELSL